MLHVLFIVRNYTSIILNFTQLDFVVFSKCMYIIWEILIMNKTTIKKKHKNRKNSLSYRKLRRWVLPAVLGAALSTLAIIPTLAAETQPNTNIAIVTTTCLLYTSSSPFYPCTPPDADQVVSHRSHHDHSLLATHAIPQ